MLLDIDIRKCRSIAIFVPDALSRRVKQDAFGKRHRWIDELPGGTAIHPRCGAACGHSHVDATSLISKVTERAQTPILRAMLLHHLRVESKATSSQDDTM